MDLQRYLLLVAAAVYCDLCSKNCPQIYELVRYRTRTFHTVYSQLSVWGTEIRDLVYCSQLLKGQCHEMFCFWFFHESEYPPAPEYLIRTISNFFKNSQRYSQVKVHHRYQRHRRQICHLCQQHRRQILPPVALVLFIPVANLPLVSTTPVAICHRFQQHQQIRLLRP
jgi:hypothetical protein